ncbi:hypothetical protein [Nocardiopsis alba]|nr:hypothetical protein [Nocardiopsis alba]
MTTAARTLHGAGYHVDVLDLYAEGWAPVLRREQFTSTEDRFKPQAEQVRAVSGRAPSTARSKTTSNACSPPTCSSCRSRCGGSRCPPSSRAGWTGSS